MDNDLWTTYQEKIRRAKSRETNNLHSHFVTTKEKIGDFEVVPITLERFALLSIDEVWNSADPSIPVLRALWILSPDFSTDPIKAKSLLRKIDRSSGRDTKRKFEIISTTLFCSLLPLQRRKKALHQGNGFRALWTPSRASTGGKNQPSFKLHFPDSFFTFEG